jgi:hypothetical protein
MPVSEGGVITASLDADASPVTAPAVIASRNFLLLTDLPDG